MRATISAREPNILRDANQGDVFIVHTPALQECASALLTNSSGAIVACGIECYVVVIASRVAIGEPGYLSTGSRMPIHPETPITFLEQVEPTAFRERARKGEIRELALHPVPMETLFVKTAAGFEAAPAAAK